MTCLFIEMEKIRKVIKFEINKDIITDTINTVYDFVKEIDFFKLKKKLGRHNRLTRDPKPN